MQNPHELFDVVDEQDRVIAQATRQEVHSEGLRHRAVHVLLFTPEGKLLVQKRSTTKDTFPGCYDSSASGHLNTGEDYDECARRELQEELGVEVPAGALQRLHRLEACADTGWEFVWVYWQKGNFQPRPNPDEVVSITPVTLPELNELIALYPERFARAFIRLVRELREHDRWPVSG